MAGELVIGYDGSDASEHAIRASAPLLAPRRALVVVVWEAGVAYEAFEFGADITPAPLQLDRAAEIDRAMYEGAQRLARRGAQLASEAGYEAEGLAVADERTVPDTIVHVAGERGAQAIVVGRHGRRGLSEVLLGSTSKGVVERSRRPVLVVPLGEA